MSLKCGVPECKHVVRALTGMQEVEKLRRHLIRAHDMNPNMPMDVALAWRARFEEKQAAEEAAR